MIDDDNRSSHSNITLQSLSTDTFRISSNSSSGGNAANQELWNLGEQEPLPLLPPKERAPWVAPPPSPPGEVSKDLDTTAMALMMKKLQE